MLDNVARKLLSRVSGRRRSEAGFPLPKLPRIAAERSLTSLKGLLDLSHRERDLCEEAVSWQGEIC
jgi:hypothetical protein